MTLSIGIDATTWWNDRGFGRFTRELVKALVARADGRFSYTLVTDRVPEDGELPVGVQVLSASADRTVTEAAVQDGARSPQDMLRLGAGVARASLDVFYFPAVYSYFPLLAPVPTIVCFHDCIAERFPELTFPTARNRRLWQAKTELARRQCRRAMTVSRASARDLQEILHIPSHRIDVVTEAADPVFRPSDPKLGAAVRTELGIPTDRKLFVYVGGLNPHKNLLRLVDAMKSVVGGRRDAHLAIVGDLSGRGFYDNARELRARVEADPDLRGHVTFTGYLSDARLVDLYASSYAMVFPSLWEGFGLPAVEAMACGLPVLASRRASLPEVVGRAGRFFDPEDALDIAEVMLGLLADEAGRDGLARAASRRAGDFTWDAGAALAEQSFLRCATGRWVS